MFQKNPKLKIIFFLGFLLSLHFAFTAYINSSFLSMLAGIKIVPLIYVAGSICSLVLLFFTPIIIRKMGEYKFLLYSSILNALSLLLLSTLKSSYELIFIFIFYLTLNNLIIFAIDGILQIFSKNSSMGRVRGLYLTTINLAWVSGQAISTKAFFTSSLSFLYFVAFMIMAVFIFIVFLGLKNMKEPIYDKVAGWESFKKFFANKNLTRAYKINFLLQFFFVWMIIYTPIYLSAHLGFSWVQIGEIFTVMLLPFVLLQFPLGNYSDKIGERKMLMLGFSILSISTLCLFFLTKPVIWIWALALFSTRVGAAMIEVMSDVYFFKHIESRNDEFISVYRNTGPVSYIIAPISALILLNFLPSFNFIFLILGTIMLYGVYLSSRIKRKDL